MEQPEQPVRNEFIGTVAGPVSGIGHACQCVSGINCWFVRLMQGHRSSVTPPLRSSSADQSEPWEHRASRDVMPYSGCECFPCMRQETGAHQKEGWHAPVCCDAQLGARVGLRRLLVCSGPGNHCRRDGGSACSADRDSCWPPLSWRH